jgi:hypothetical protein
MATLQDLLDHALPADAPIVSALPPAFVAAVIEEASASVGECRYGANATRARALLALHLLSLSGLLTDGGASGQVVSEANGPASRSFWAPQIAAGESEGAYASSPYGRRFALLRRSAVAISAFPMIGGSGVC